jgi:very-short-patch-repair endonuclease
VTEKLTLDQYRELEGKRSGARARNTKNELALINLINLLARVNGIEFGGKWRKGMEVESSTLYLEYPFSKTRRYRADLAIPTERLIIEIHGGSWVMRRSKDGSVQYLGGAHHSPTGRRRDMEKANLANIEGWTYLEVEWKDVQDGSAYELICRVLDGR